MTSCVHKMWGRTYGQTNMKRAITLAKCALKRNIGKLHYLLKKKYIFQIVWTPPPPPQKEAKSALDKKQPIIPLSIVSKVETGLGD
jgi:hypothetical protein